MRLFRAIFAAAELAAIEHKLDRLIAVVRDNGDKTMINLDRLIAQSTALKSASDAIELQHRAVVEELRLIRQQIEDQPEVQARIDAVADMLESEAGDLSRAALANTPGDVPPQGPQTPFNNPPAVGGSTVPPELSGPIVTNDAPSTPEASADAARRAGRNPSDR